MAHTRAEVILTRVVVNAGICGFTTTVEVARTARRRVKIVLASDCEAVAGMNG
jgi:hypothetical protein